MGIDDVHFNQRVYIFIMCLKGKPVLRLVVETTNFSAARFLKKISTDDIWETIIDVGLPYTRFFLTRSWWIQVPSSGKRLQTLPTFDYG